MEESKEITITSGLQYIDQVQGTGTQAVAGKTATVHATLIFKIELLGVE